jgi:hypothetical protein
MKSLADSQLRSPDLPTIERSIAFLADCHEKALRDAVRTAHDDVGEVVGEGDLASVHTLDGDAAATGLLKSLTAVLDRMWKAYAFRSADAAVVRMLAVAAETAAVELGRDGKLSAGAQVRFDNAIAAADSAVRLVTAMVEAARCGPGPSSGSVSAGGYCGISFASSSASAGGVGGPQAAQHPDTDMSAAADGGRGRDSGGKGGGGSAAAAGGGLGGGHYPKKPRLPAAVGGDEEGAGAAPTRGGASSSSSSTAAIAAAAPALSAVLQPGAGEMWWHCPWCQGDRIAKAHHEYTFCCGAKARHLDQGHASDTDPTQGARRAMHRGKVAQCEECC